MAASSRAVSARNDAVASIHEFVLGYQAAELKKAATGAIGVYLAARIMDTRLQGRR